MTTPYESILNDYLNFSGEKKSLPLSPNRIGIGDITAVAITIQKNHCQEIS
jgi:hypothetical protein